MPRLSKKLHFLFFTLFGCTLLQSLVLANKEEMVNVSGLFFLKHNTVNNNLPCVTCFEVPDWNSPPMECACGKHICQKCEPTLKATQITANLTCPHCKRASETKFLTQPEWKHRFATLAIQCEHSLCDWTLTFDPEKFQDKDYTDHINDCPYTEHPCTYCKGLTCRKDIENHENYTCPKRPVECTGCKKDVPFDELDEHHVAECHILQLQSIGQTTLSYEQLSGIVQNTASILIHQEESRKTHLRIIQNSASRIHELERQLEKMKFDAIDWVELGTGSHEAIVSIDAKDLESELQSENSSYRGTSQPFVIHSGWSDEQRPRQVILLVKKIIMENLSPLYDVNIMVSYKPSDNPGDERDIDWSSNETLDVAVLFPHSGGGRLRNLSKSENAVLKARPKFLKDEKHYQPYYNMYLGRIDRISRLQKYIHDPEGFPRFKVKVSLPEAVQGTHRLLSEQASSSYPLKVINNQLQLIIPADTALGKFNDTPDENLYGKNYPLTFFADNEEWSMHIKKLYNKVYLVMRLLSDTSHNGYHQSVIQTMRASPFSPSLPSPDYSTRQVFHFHTTLPSPQVKEGGYRIVLIESEDTANKYRVGDYLFINFVINEDKEEKPLLRVSGNTGSESRRGTQHSVNIGTLQRRVTDAETRTNQAYKHAMMNTVDRLQRQYATRRETGDIATTSRDSAVTVTWNAQDLVSFLLYDVTSPHFTVDGNTYYLSMESFDNQLWLMLHTTRKLGFSTAQWRRGLDSIDTYRTPASPVNNLIPLTPPRGKEGKYTRNKRWATLRSKDGLPLSRLFSPDFKSHSGFTVTVTFTLIPQPQEIHEGTSLLHDVAQ